DQIPDDDVSVARATGESDSCVVEGKLGNGGFVTIERNDSGADDKSKNIPYSKNVLVNVTLRDNRYLRGAILISPPCQKISLLHIPHQDFLPRADDGPSSIGLACSRSQDVIFGPNRV
ncbi:hypothetical protein KEM55_000747, partial [Ascosphaera atra]